MHTTADQMIPGHDYTITLDGPHQMDGTTLTFLGAVDFQPDPSEPDIVLMRAQVVIDGVQQSLVFAPGDAMLPA